MATRAGRGVGFFARRGIMPPMPGRDEQFMARALALAGRGRGAVEPNPMVGAVIVREGKVIGQGWHQRFGGPHAEIEAINAATAGGADLAGATMYITLEPCCHHGKTPPCTEAILAAGLTRVVAAMKDPDPQVAGKGIEALREAGVEVVVGVLEGQARRMLAAYVKLRTTGTPWVICKWAQSLDGRIATHTGHSRWISGEAARQHAHVLRGQCDAVCVGVGTVGADDPLLTNRSGSGRQPARLVLDGELHIPLSCRLLRTIDVAPVIVAARADAPQAAAEAIAAAGAEVLPLPPGAGGVDLSALLAELGRRQWTHLLVEGGRAVLGQFIAAGLADELMVFVAPRLIGGRKSLGPVDWPDVDTVDQAPKLPPPQVEQIGPDVLLRYVLRDPSAPAPPTP